MNFGLEESQQENQQKAPYMVRKVQLSVSEMGATKITIVGQKSI